MKTKIFEKGKKYVIIQRKKERGSKMKIFNKENNQEKVYVQVKDLKKLMYKKDYVPQNILEIANTKKKENEFIEFTDSKDISFFKNQDWIIDYKELRDLSKEEIVTTAMKTNEKLEKLVHAKQVLTREKDYKGVYNIIPEYTLMQHKLESYDDIYLLKQGYNYIPFPEVEDSNGLQLVTDNNTRYCNLEVNTSLDPNSMIIAKKDKTPFNRKDHIDKNIMKQISTTMVLAHCEEIQFTGNYTINSELSEDNTKIIIKLKTVPNRLQKEIETIKK